MSDWRDAASCKGLDPDLFYADHDPTVVARARAVCADCPVKAECLEAGLHERHGVWGGTTERERRRLRPQPVCKHCGRVEVHQSSHMCVACRTELGRQEHAERSRLWRLRRRQA